MSEWLLNLAKAAETVKKVFYSPARQVRGMIDAEKLAESEGYIVKWRRGNAAAVIRDTISQMPSDNPHENAEKLRNLSPDWAVHAREGIENTSEPYMQSLWAKILGGEAERPGSFSKRTVDIVKALSKEDALLFSDFCQFVWSVGGEHAPLIYDWNHKIYDIRQYRIYGAIQKLADCRLISTPGGEAQHMQVLTVGGGFSGYGKKFIYPECHCAYFDASVLVNIPPAVVGQSKYQFAMSLGSVKFTEAGRELYRICEVQKNDAFFQYAVEKWMELGYNPHSVWPKVDEKGRE